MNNISVKIDENLRKKLTLTARKTRISQSELIRRALTHYLDQQTSSGEFQSAADLAGDLAGCVAGGPADLAENPEYLDDFGR
ncbi:MAG: ribbon-helix-helix domain-containing protein [Wenzhouxiangellaceae bacterium]